MKCVAVLKADEGKFPIKMREQAINASCNFLNSKGLFPEDDDDSDEMVFGDDDFPCDAEEEETPADDVIPEVSEEGFHEKKIKVVKKEGGKKGSELAGAADMGGIEYFTTTAETPEGDSRLLEIVNQEMNAEIDPAEEETKGGSKHVAKCVLSAGDKQLAIVTYVPKSLLGKVVAGEWMT